jgi:hypothetical protein
MNTEKPTSQDNKKTTERAQPEREQRASSERSSLEPTAAEKAVLVTQAASRAAQSVEHALDQVREILFGAVQRDLEAGIVRSDTRVTQRLRDLEGEIRRRADVLETHLKKEMEALSTRVDKQLGELNETLRTLTREQRDAMGQAERKMARIEEASAISLRDLRDQMLQQAKSFLDELQEVRRELLATFQRELDIDDAGEGGRDVKSGAPH